MKKILKILSVVMLLSAFLMPNAASAATWGDYEYSINMDGTCTITNYTGSGGDVVIPDTISGYTVGGIGEEAFFFTNLTSIDIPDTVTEFGALAFSLDTFTLPGSASDEWHGSDGGVYTGGDTVSSIYGYTKIQIFLYTDNGDSTCTITGYGGSDTDITIPGTLDSLTVTDIASQAFKNKNITSVVLPASLKTIEFEAFANNHMSSLTIPSGVTEINDFAFAYNLLQSVVIPSTVTYIGSGAFNSNQIANVNGSASQGLIYARNTDGTEDTKTVVSYGGAAIVINFIPSNVQTISNYAFANCLLASVTIPDGVSHISDRAFTENSLTTISLPTSLMFIGEQAFAQNAFSNFNLPATLDTWDASNGVTHPGGSSVSINYSYQRNVEFAYFDNGNGTCVITSYNGTSTTPVIPDTLDDLTVVGLDYESFANKGLTSVTLPANLQFIGEWALANNSLTSITIPSTVNSIGNAAFNNNAIATLNGQATDGIIYAMHWGTSSWEFDTTKIASYGGASDTINFIPASVTTINTNAFNSCGITSVTIPDNVTEIGTRAFYSNPIPHITLPAGTGEWSGSDGNSYMGGDNVDPLYSYKILTDWEYSDNMNGTCTITAYSGTDTDLTIPTQLGGMDVVNIEANVFESKGLTSVTLPSTLKQIGTAAFRFNGLTSVIIPDGVFMIEPEAFSGNSIATLVLPSSITELGGGAFSNNAINSLNGQASNGIIYSRNNDGTDDIHRLSSYGGTSDVVDFIPDSVFMIEQNAFAGCGITSVTLPNQLQLINNGAFKYNALTQITFPTTLQYIGSEAFINNTLTTFNLPATADSWEGSDTVVYPGGSLVSVDYEYTRQMEYTYKNNGDGTCTIVNYGGASTNPTIPSTLDGLTVTTIDAYAFSEKSLTGVTLPNTVTDILFMAFAQNNISSLTIPASVTNIEIAAFNGNAITTINGEASDGLIYMIKEDGTQDLSHVVSYGGGQTTIDFIPSTVEVLDTQSFIYCGITSVTLPDSLLFIGTDAFTENDISEFTLPAAGAVWHCTESGETHAGGSSVSVDGTYYRTSDFESSDNGDGTCKVTGYNGTALDVVIPNTISGLTVVEIGDLVFSDKGLTSVVIPNTVKTIGYRSFDLNELTSVTLPTSLEVIGLDAFNGNALTSIEIPASVKTLATRSFMNNELTTIIFPRNLDAMGRAVFNNNKITTVNGQASNGIIYALDGSGGFDTSTITSYGGVETNINFIPASVTTIDNAAFSGCTLTGLTIPSTVEIIEDWGFFDCSLPSVTIPNSVKFIGLRAFDSNSFTTFTLPDVNGAWAGSNEETYFGGDSVSVSFEYEWFNPLPTIIAGVDHSVYTEIFITETYSVDLSKIFEDIGGDALTFQVNPDGAGYGSTDSSFSVTPAELGTYVFEFRAHDGVAYSDDIYTVTLTVTPDTDINDDGVTDILDVAMVSQSYGTTEDICDMNKDGIVNLFDIVFVARRAAQ